MSRFLLVIIVVLFAGDAVASDASWGNLRSILTRPIGRSRLLVAKAESAGVLAVIATALVVISALVAGIIAFGWHPLDLPLHGFDQSAAQIVGNLAIASVYVLWAMAGVAALAFMVSTMTDSPATAVFAGFGLYIVSQILDGITSLGSIRYGLPTHYFDAWTSLFTDPARADSRHAPRHAPADPLRRSSSVASHGGTSATRTSSPDSLPRALTGIGACSVSSARNKRDPAMHVTWRPVTAHAVRPFPGPTGPPTWNAC